MTMTRRGALRLFLGGLGGVILGAGTARSLRPTPACDDGDGDPTESSVQGPFYRPNTPERKVLREAGIPGASLVLTGHVLTPYCRPLAGAVLDFWSCDGAGAYDNKGFKLRGHQYTDAKGAYRLETVRPSDYRERGLHRTPHIHVKVQGRGTRLLTTQLFFPGEPLNDQDYLFRDSLVIDLAPAGKGSFTGRFDFVLA